MNDSTLTGSTWAGMIIAAAWVSLGWVPPAAALEIGEYVDRFLESRPRLKEAEAEVETQELRQEQAGTARRTDASAEARTGPHLFTYTGPRSSEAIGTLESQGTVEHRFPNAHRLSGELHLDPVTEPHPVAGQMTYGASASYLVPVLGNRRGKVFDLRAEAEGLQLDSLRVSAREQRKRSCSEALRRYVQSYVARKRLEVFRDLLEDKVRMFNQTSADYQKKMVTRLDYLAARSDWLEAKSRKREFVESLEQADARLRTYVPVDEDARLEEPEWTGPSMGDDGTLRERLREAHPELRAIDRRIQALEVRRDVIREELKPSLNIGGTVGFGRFHDTALLSGRVQDVTDVRGLVVAELEWPIARPSRELERQVLSARKVELEHRRERVLRRLLERIDTLRAELANKREQLEIVRERRVAARRQIEEARKQYRQGKLEFQDFLDHWELYRRARLDRWSIQGAIWRARADLVAVTPGLPEVCR